MKKKLFVAITLVFTLILVLAMPVLAGPSGAWNTDFTLFNLSSSSADITITRFSKCVPVCGTDAGTVVMSTSIAGSGSYYYNPVSDSSFPAGFAGSITISSTQPLAGTVTLANNLTGAGYASDAYSAVSTAATTIYLPIVLRMGVWSSRVTVQNTAATNANVTLNFVGSGAPAPTTISNLPPNMMAMVDLSDMGSLNFNGSATVTSTNPVAVVVEEYKTSGGIFVTYNGIPSIVASDTVYLPGYIDKGYWDTDMTIVSTGGSGTATVSFAGNGASLSGPVSPSNSPYLNRNGSLPSGWSGTFPTSYYGAATVTSTTPVVVAYNIANTGTGGPSNLGMGYVGFSDTQGAKTVVVPLIENAYHGVWNTTFSVQSLDGTPATLSMTYSGNLSPICNPCIVTMSTASQTFNQLFDGHVPAGFIGGVKIISDRNIVVIGDQAGTAPSIAAGDTAAGFPGFALP